MTRRRAALPSSLGVLILGVLAATALGEDLGSAGGVSYEYGHDHAGAGLQSTARAACPGRKHPTGGGFELSSGMGFSTYEAAASMPADGPDGDHRPDDAWLVRGRAVDPATSSSYAICAKGDYRYRSKTAPVPSGSGKAAKVGCGGTGWHVTGGGGAVSDSKKANLSAVFPFDNGDHGDRPDDGWTARAQVRGPGVKLTAAAVCTRSRPTYRTATQTLTPGLGSRLSAECATGHHVLGIGGNVSGGPEQGGFVELAQPADGTDVGTVPDNNGAVFNELPASATSAQTSTAFAICTG